MDHKIFLPHSPDLDLLSSGCIILVNKPIEMTSFFVVNLIKKAIKRNMHREIKIGHAGTLDPLATGLLILCTGKLTKQISDFQIMTKTYSGTITIGAATESYDLETPIYQTFETSHINEADIEMVRKSFEGEQEIVPPMHSAIKVDGKRAYKLARKGETLDIKPRSMQIHQIDLEANNFPVLKFKIVCSKGTYIRSIAHEMGKRLHSGGYLSDLSRDYIGNYALSDSWNLDLLLDLLRSQGHK